jgi:hypothetical protein
MSSPGKVARRCYRALERTQVIGKRLTVVLELLKLAIAGPDDRLRK